MEAFTKCTNDCLCSNTQLISYEMIRLKIKIHEYMCYYARFNDLRIFLTLDNLSSDTSRMRIYM